MCKKCLAAVVVGLLGPAQCTLAEEPTARVAPFYNYTQAVELKLGQTRAVVSPQAGGRVLKFSVDGVDALYLDPGEKGWRSGKPGPISAGRSCSSRSAW